MKHQNGNSAIVGNGSNNEKMPSMNGSNNNSKGAAQISLQQLLKDAELLE